MKANTNVLIFAQCENSLKTTATLYCLLGLKPFLRLRHFCGIYYLLNNIILLCEVPVSSLTILSYFFLFPQGHKRKQGERRKIGKKRHGVTMQMKSPFGLQAEC